MAGKSIQLRGMEEASENGKESSHSARQWNEMNELPNITDTLLNTAPFKLFLLTYP
jgi:hypothetical protein